MVSLNMLSQALEKLGNCSRLCGGKGQGDIIAAMIAGIMTLEEGLRLINVKQ